MHLLPSGIIHPEKQVVIGANVVLDPKALLNEFDYLTNKNINLENRLFIDERTHVILPHHRIIDICSEMVKSKGGKKIGTTGM